MKLCTLNVCSLSPSALMHVRPLAVVLTPLLHKQRKCKHSEGRLCLNGLFAISRWSQDTIFVDIKLH